jgi:pimeloyl-ACP methyl ester carboxylesterase
VKRLASFLIVFSIFSLACQTLMNPNFLQQLPTDVPNTENTAVSPNQPTETLSEVSDITAKLDELGGKPCPNNSDFICVTIPVPLDHFDTANTETINVTFAVAPAQGKRKGMYIQAFPGGPGGEGISYASTGYFSQDVLDQYDIVFFDQRGLGLSSPLQCKQAYAKYFLDYLNTNDTAGQEGLDTPQEQQTAVTEAKSFVDECITEIGIDPGKLKFYKTDQVAEDIESFRQAIGDDKFMLYGVSYGTSVAQTYARAHADHLSGLILDGVQDTTQTGDQTAFSQRDAFNEVLSAIFQACDADSECSQGLEGGAQAAYDQLAQKLAQAPIPYDIAGANGEIEHRLFTFNMFDFTVSYQLYNLSTRRDLMKAIAAAKAGDMTPLALEYYDNAHIDITTTQYVGDPNFSDTMYYVVWCSDDAYYSGTSDERTAKLFQAGQQLVGLVPRLDLDVLTLGLVCTNLPSSPTTPDKIEPLKAPRVPTFVLNATLDPATPYHEGESVFKNLDDGYHLYVKGGPHGILGWGFDCPDQYINDFLTKGQLPPQREMVCDWGNAVLGK